MHDYVTAEEMRFLLYLLERYITPMSSEESRKKRKFFLKMFFMKIEKGKVVNLYSVDCL